MKTFKKFLDEEAELLLMAYDYFPTSATDIERNLDWPDDRKKEVIALFNYLKKDDSTPINIDKNKKSLVNVSRSLQGVHNLDTIKTAAKLNLVNVKYGNGSSGNRGANNRGNAFETQFATALEAWYQGEQVKDTAILAAIEDLDKHYKLRNSKTFDAAVVGGENTKRPLNFTGKIHLENPKGSGNDVGKSVTDITLTGEGISKPVYLSLKFETTTTFFNSGIKTILTKAEIDKGEIKNANGLKLLKLFGVDPKRFCTIFSDNFDSDTGVVRARPNRDIQHLLKSGIGSGYHIIHKMGRRVLSKKMDTRAMNTAASVGSVTIYYGGKTGRGKRIDMEMESRTYKFKLNIRDTQGRDGYPTRMMCDFKYK